jgi:hypothetical protein
VLTSIVLSFRMKHLGTMLILVARYLRATLTVTNTQVGASQPRYGEGGEAIAHKACCPFPFHLPFPSYCDAAQVRRLFIHIMIKMRNMYKNRLMKDKNGEPILCRLIEDV